MFFRDMDGTSFVCIDDITGKPEDLNKVIYNPNRDAKEIIPVKLFNDVNEVFGVQLSQSEIAMLTSYDANHLNEFAQNLRSIIKNKRGG